MLFLKPVFNKKTIAQCKPPDCDMSHIVAPLCAFISFG